MDNFHQVVRCPRASVSAMMPGSRLMTTIAFLFAILSIPVFAGAVLPFGLASAEARVLQEAAPETAPTSAPSTRLAAPLQLTDWTRKPPLDPSETNSPRLRIVSAAPNVTEICCALGLLDQLVGRTRYCTWPPEVEKVASVGALIDFSTESLLALKPDLVILSGASRSQAEKLKSLNVRSEFISDVTLKDLFDGIEKIGGWAGRPRTAHALRVGVEADLASVDRKFARAAARRCLFLIEPLAQPARPPFVAGPGSFYDELLRRAGHSNVIESQDAQFGPLSLEALVRIDPPWVIELCADDASRPRGDVDALKAWSALGNLRAVRERHVRVLSGPRGFLLGPRIAMTYQDLCEALAREERP